MSLSDGNLRIDPEEMGRMRPIVERTSMNNMPESIAGKQRNPTRELLSASSFFLFSFLVFGFLGSEGDNILKRATKPMSSDLFRTDLSDPFLESMGH